MIDTHAHIYLDVFQEDIDEVIRKAKGVGVEKIMMPNIDADTLEDMLQVAKKHADFCLPMMGLHPCSVNENYQKDLKVIFDKWDSNLYYAVGEMGIDLYWDSTFKTEQIEALNIQCEWALQYNLPIVIHCRNAFDLTYDSIKTWAKKGVKGVFHCFDGTQRQAQQIVDIDFYIGIGGMATFKKSALSSALPHLDKNKVLLETDSPYLAPTPYRGKRNEPSFLIHIAEKLAESWDVTLYEVDRLTTDNAKRLFRL